MNSTAVVALSVRSLLLLMLVSFVLDGRALAQGAGRVSGDYRVEVGACVKWFDRDLSGDGARVDDDKWYRETAYINVMLTPRLSVLLSGMIRGAKTYDEYPDRMYRVSTVGAGAAFYPVIGETYSLGISSGFHQTIWFDESSQRYHMRHHNFEFGVYLLRSIWIGRQMVDCWIGPTVMIDEVSYYRGHGGRTAVGSEDDFGFGVGGSSMIFAHLRSYARVAHVGTWQYEGGLGYQF